MSPKPKRKAEQKGGKAAKKGQPSAQAKAVAAKKKVAKKKRAENGINVADGAEPEGEISSEIDERMRASLSRHLFKKVDVDGSGELDLEEFTRVCQRLNEEITEVEVLESFKKCEPVII